MTALLEAANVGKTFGGGLFDKKKTVALQTASLQIHGDRPSITAIAGESGSGKTTLARLLLGITQPSSGEILYNGQNLQKLNGNDWKVFRREVQAVFQDPFAVYNPFYAVDHALTSPISKFFPRTSKATAQQMIEDALRAVGLRPEETLGRYPHQLSGGQRQRIMVARALLLKPRIIIADEPVSMVDASLRATILESLLTVHKQFGISLIYITHDLTTAYQLCENILIMYQGNVVEAGDVDRVIKEPHHPYTQLLVDSIPQANPKIRWGQRDFHSPSGTTSNGAGKIPGKIGCAFADRCPLVMAVCREQVPPSFRIHERQAAACFLYDNAPTVEPDDVVDA